MPPRAILSAAIICLYLLPVSNADDNITALAVVDILEGSGRVKPPESEGWLDAETGTELTDDYKFKTLVSSRAVLRIGSAKVRLDSNTEVKIVQENIDETALPAMVSVDSGEIWVNVGNIFGMVIPGVALKTSNAIMRVSVGNDGTSEIKVYRGTVEAKRYISVDDQAELKGRIVDSSKAEANSIEPEIWNEELHSLSKLIVFANGDISSKSVFSNDDIDETVSWVEWNKEKDGLD